VSFRFTIAALTLGLLLRVPDSADAAVARSGQVVMGTVLTVTVVAEYRARAEALAEAAIAEARRWDDALTIWRLDGELAALNARAGQGPFPTGRRLASGLAAMLHWADQTGGAFEPAVGALPAGGVRGAALRGIRETLRLQSAAATLDKNARLDPGAIGKGLALDAIVDLLREEGVKAAFLDFGGSSQTGLGVPPGDDRGWGVLVAALATSAFHGTLRLRDASLSTSLAAATDTRPILDPRSGMPVEGPRLVTVLASRATAADAWSTALVVLGRDGVREAESKGLEVLLEDGAGVLRTPGFDLRP